MQHFDLVASGEAKSGLNSIFNHGVSRENADVVLEMFPSREKVPNRRQEGVIVVLLRRENT